MALEKDSIDVPLISRFPAGHTHAFSCTFRAIRSAGCQLVLVADGSTDSKYGVHTLLDYYI